MSALGNMVPSTQQLQQDLQNELTTSNELLRLISQYQFHQFAACLPIVQHACPLHVLQYVVAQAEQMRFRAARYGPTLSPYFKEIDNVSIELQQIKHLTSPGGEFESNLCKNSSLVKTLANMQQVDIENLPTLTRQNIQMS